MKKYSTINNYKFILKKGDKKANLFMLLLTPVKMLTPIIPVVITSYIINSLTNNITLELVLSTTCGLIILLNLLQFCEKSGDSILKHYGVVIRMKFIEIICKKVFDTDYHNIEQEDFQNKFSNVANRIATNGTSIEKFYTCCNSAIAILLSITLYGIILSKLNPIIIFVIIIASVGHFYFMQRSNLNEKEYREVVAKPERLRGYLKRYSQDYSIGKDIRIFNMSGLFADKFKNNSNELMQLFKKDQNKLLKIELIIGSITFIRDIICYGYLVNLLILDGLNAGDFVFYFGAIRVFSAIVYDFFMQIKTLEDISIRLTELREFIDFPDRLNRGIGEKLPVSDYSIKLKNVNFSYPSKEELTLKNINLSIKAGEKIAIVGLNGAGKTTLVKLLCGFYEVTSGEILVGGININKFNIFEYYKEISAVFQSTVMLPISIKDNIKLGVEKDKNLDELLKKAGLEVSKFINGVDTKLNKNINEDAIDISGGEIQKLSLAKALYKDGKILILDEPTAALDPIAEQEMYQNYSEMTKGKTSIFISHRLSSTRFCDRIIFLEDGEIAEIGTHDELISHGGKYKELFDIQSHYYQENIEDIENIMEEI